MSAEITSIHGAPTTLPGEPHPDVVACLERLIAQARRGEIVGFAMGYVDGAGSACTILLHGAAGFNNLTAAVSVLHSRWAAQFRNERLPLAGN